MEEKKNKSYNTIEIFVYIWKKRKSIAIITVTGAIISVIVSLLLTDYYRASAVLLPTTFASPQKGDPLLIGDEDDLERLIQILKSEYISNKIISKYDLISHYGLRKDDPYVSSKLMKKYNSNFSFNKTQYQGVVISVLDKDPKLAANMANEIIFLVDSMAYKMQKERALQVYEIALENYNKERKFIEMLEDSLDYYRQIGILDYDLEVERYSEAYGKAIGRNTLTPAAEKFFQSKFQLLQKYGKKFRHFMGTINALRQNEEKLQLELVQAKTNISRAMSRRYVISYAHPPDKKIFPQRYIIIILSTIGSLVIAIALSLLTDFLKQVKEGIKERGNAEHHA